MDVRVFGQAGFRHSDVNFDVDCPSAEHVYPLLRLHDRASQVLPMRPPARGDERWRLVLSLPPGRHTYRFYAYEGDRLTLCGTQPEPRHPSDREGAEPDHGGSARSAPASSCPERFAFGAEPGPGVANRRPRLVGDERPLWWRAGVLPDWRWPNQRWD